MTAQEIATKFFESDPNRIMTKNQLIIWLKDFALLKCAEQREICADIPYLEYEDDRIKILNAENPEM